MKRIVHARSAGFVHEIALVVALAAGCVPPPVTCGDLKPETNCGANEIAQCQRDSAEGVEPECVCGNDSRMYEDVCVNMDDHADYGDCCACLDYYATEPGGRGCLDAPGDGRDERVANCVSTLDHGDGIDIRAEVCVTDHCPEACDFIVLR